MLTRTLDCGKCRAGDVRIARHDVFRALFEKAPDPMLLADDERRYVDANPAACAFFGREHADIVGRTIDEFATSEAKPGIASASASFIAPGEVAHEDILMTKAGPRQVESRTVADVLPGLHLSILRNVTEWKRAVEQRRSFDDVVARRELETQLLRAQKLEAVGLLAGGVAHDFNNLLTVIEGYASLAQSEVTAESPFLTQALEEIRGAAGRAAALTRKLLAFSRRQVLRSTVADSKAIVSSALDLVDSLIGEDIVVHRRLEPDAGNILADVAQLEQVIVNLVVNARDAMPSGGNIHVESKRVELDAGSVSDLEPGAYVCLIVRDDGCGMDDQTREQIFDPFFTTKPVDRGTGLGLASAYGTITQSGGHVAVTSKPGEGSTFTIHLPRCEQPISSPHPSSPEPVARRGRERVLVVEDQENVRRLMVRILESYGYELFEAEDPQEALSLCEDLHFDLMVTDLVMPGGDGASLARTAGQLQPGIRILYTSGDTSNSVDHGELEAKTASFLAKPFSTDELAHRVRDLLDRQEGDCTTDLRP